MSTPSHLSPSYTRISTHTSPSYFFFFNDTATTEIYTLSLHDALPISDWPSAAMSESARMVGGSAISASTTRWLAVSVTRSEEHTSELQSRLHLVCRLLLEKKKKNQRIPTADIRSLRDTSAVNTERSAG